MLLMQFILEIVEQFADTLHVYQAEQNCCQMIVIVKQKCIFSSWAHVNIDYDYNIMWKHSVTRNPNTQC